jgi:hypothetical protein
MNIRLANEQVTYPVSKWEENKELDSERCIRKYRLCDQKHTFKIWCESEKCVGNMRATHRKITKQNSGNFRKVPSETDVDTLK